MKLSMIGGVILLLTLVFFLFGQIIDDMNANYGNTSISPTGGFNRSIISDFDDIERINKSIKPIQDLFEIIDEKRGFLDIIGNFAIVLPKAIIAVPASIFTIGVLGKSRLEDILMLVGINRTVIDIAIIALALLIIFGIVGWWHRRDI